MNELFGHLCVLITITLTISDRETVKQFAQPQPVPQNCPATFLGHVSPKRDFFVRISVETRERRSLGLRDVWPRTRTRGRNSNGNIMECGGALVDKEWVLTFAGCLKGKISRISVEAGDFTMTNRNKTRIITTRGYLQQNRHNLLNNGLALIKLSRHFRDDQVIKLCGELSPAILETYFLASCGMGRRLIDLKSSGKLSDFLVESYFWSDNGCYVYDEVCYPIMDPSMSCGSFPGAPLYLIDYNDEMDVKCLYGIAQGERKKSAQLLGYNETSEKTFWSVPKSKGWILNTIKNN